MKKNIIKFTNVQNLADEINSAIRLTSEIVKEAIIKEDYETFSSMTHDMIIASKYSYKGYERKVKDIIVNTCFALNQYDQKKTKYSIDKIADKFYQKMMACTASYMN